ncbi:hypothetical protein F5J12DRAFT_819741, partial [Pisolithus orientalis]|uniref:uncharacterized protein n=1 Tax=Pisolithus orientalis TaxID=936130 RepID=UPI002225262C
TWDVFHRPLSQRWPKHGESHPRGRVIGVHFLFLPTLTAGEYLACHIRQLAKEVLGDISCVVSTVALIQSISLFTMMSFTREKNNEWYDPADD